MDAMNTSVRAHKEFIAKLRRDFPKFSFKEGAQDHWSPKTNTITYKSDVSLQELQYGILHELAHAKLGHHNYHNDFELLKLESLAWELAAKIGKKYGVKIDDEHIQNCLDTYRDWLHARSTCPTCGMNVLQKDPYHYHCFNCQTEWKVTSGRFVRPYRLTLG
ncbi:MAG TPA: hypothetical protein VLE51_03350 [Candidatus Saccharimonadales bacterium]|nr:hypothetical protein [Candidatus Saccharimonadales bacterium]